MPVLYLWFTHMFGLLKSRRQKHQIPIHMACIKWEKQINGSVWRFAGQKKKKTVQNMLGAVCICKSQIGNVLSCDAFKNKNKKQLKNPNKNCICELLWDSQSLLRTDVTVQCVFTINPEPAMSVCLVSHWCNDDTSMMAEKCTYHVSFQTKRQKRSQAIPSNWRHHVMPNL